MGRSLIPARAPHTVTREVDGGFVVLDRDRAHALEGDYATVWAAAGTTGVVDPAALAELTDLGLLDAPGVTRRSMLRRSGVVAAGVAGVGIASIVLPTAAMAASGPTASISPTSGPKGTVVTLSGSGYGPNKLIQVTVNGVSATVTNSVGGGAGTITTDASGNIPTGTKFTIPDTGANTGPQPVAVLVTGSPSTSAGNFNISTPVVVLSQTTFTKNSSPGTFTVTSSSGFFPSTGFTDAAAGNFSNLTPTSGTTTAGGAIPTGVTYTVDYASGATKAGTITFTDSKGNTATVPVQTGP